MDTIICDITAFDYWRIPPIVQLLLAGNETDPVLTSAANASSRKPRKSGTRSLGA